MLVQQLLLLVCLQRLCVLLQHQLLQRRLDSWVLAVFSRIPVGTRNLEWLRTIADSAATALANARAWEEIGALRPRDLALCRLRAALCRLHRGCRL